MDFGIILNLTGWGMMDFVLWRMDWEVNNQQDVKSGQNEPFSLNLTSWKMH